MAYKLIGLGGIGCRIVQPLCQYLACSRKSLEEIWLIDGDSYKSTNSDRQLFDDTGNKAEVTATMMKRMFPSLIIEAKPHFVTIDNAFLFIKETDIVFLAVDKHIVRRLVSYHCAGLDNVILISGGNLFDRGNLQNYIRKDGKDLTPSITRFHPEIENATDKNPADMGCDELAQDRAPQLIFTNLMAAAHMLATFWKVVEKKEIGYTDLSFDLVTGMAESFSFREGGASATNEGGGSC